MNSTSLLKKQLLSELVQFGVPTVPSSEAKSEMTIASLRQIGEVKLAQARALTESTTDLETARTLLSAGRIEEAELLLGRLLSITLDGDALAEVYLEVARLRSYEGDAMGAVLACEKALSLGVSGVTRLTLLQICAHNHFEIGNFCSFADNMQDLEALYLLYPTHPARRYSETLKIRWIARTRGTSYARKELDAFLEASLQRFGFNLDLLHVYLRVRNDLNRLDETLSVGLSTVCVSVAEVIGDPLYATLDRVDLGVCLGMSSLEEFQDFLGLEGSRFRKVANLLQEITAQESPVSQTGIAIKKLLGRPRARLLPPTRRPRLQNLVLLDLGLIFRLDKMELSRISPRSQALAVLGSLRNGPIEKEEFFKQIWGLPHFHPDRHGPLIRNLISRTRKQTGMQILSSSGVLVLCEHSVII